MNIYITFATKNQLLIFEKILIAHNIDYRIIPTPRSISKSCTNTIVLNKTYLSEIEDITYAYPDILYDNITVKN